MVNTHQASLCDTRTLLTQRQSMNGIVITNEAWAGRKRTGDYYMAEQGGQTERNSLSTPAFTKLPIKKHTKNPWETRVNPQSHASQPRQATP